MRAALGRPAVWKPRRFALAAMSNVDIAPRRQPRAAAGRQQLIAGKKRRSISRMELEDWHYVFVWPVIVGVLFLHFVCTRTDEDRVASKARRTMKRAVD
jgi:hypothetical protein